MQGTYMHYKGKKYKALGIALHKETQEELVVYQALYDNPQFGSNALWAQPKKRFLEKVTVKGKGVERFRKVSDE
jgi:hypothetical protein